MTTMRAASIGGVLVTLWSASSIVNADTIEDWVQRNLNRNEQVLCKLEVQHEYFFLARAETPGVLKLGARLNMSAYNTSHTFLVAWVFQDEDKRSLATKTQPTPVVNKYVKDGSMIFAEGVEYQTIVSGSGRVLVALDIKKCPTSKCDLHKTYTPQEQKYSVSVCELKSMK